jgi:hypothetical protein
LADLEAQFQALRRLVASKVGFAAFTALLGWVQSCPEAHKLSISFFVALLYAEIVTRLQLHFLFHTLDFNWLWIFCEIIVEEFDWWRMW